MKAAAAAAAALFLPLSNRLEAARRIPVRPHSHAGAPLPSVAAAHLRSERERALWCGLHKRMEWERYTQYGL